MSYCTYLTTYKGNKMPPFYIGSSSVDKVASGYCGSVKSATYGETWREELEQHKYLFETKVISIHETREDALKRENQLHKKLRVVANPLYINKATAAGTFGVMDEASIEKMRQTKLANAHITGKKVSQRRNDPLWKSTVGAVANQKLSQTKNNPEWIATMGAQRNKKNSETVNSPEWKATIGAERSRKISEAVLATHLAPDYEQKNKQRIDNLKKTLSDPVWKAAVHAEANIKRGASVSRTKSDPEWKAKHYKTCSHCDNLFAPNVLARHERKCETLTKD